MYGKAVQYMEKTISIPYNKKTLSPEYSLWKLFWEMLRVSAFTFGGGLVIVALLQKRLAEELGWLSQEEVLNFTAIAQSSPGPVAINTSILIGNKLGGRTGSIVAALATSLPPLIIITIIACWFSGINDNPYCQVFFKWARIATAATVADVALNMVLAVKKSTAGIGLAMIAAASVLIIMFSSSAPYAVAAGALFGLFFFRSPSSAAEEGQNPALQSGKAEPSVPPSVNSAAQDKN